LDSNLLRRARATRGFLIAETGVGAASAVLTLFEAWLIAYAVSFLFYHSWWDSPDPAVVAAGGWGMLWAMPPLALVFAGKALLTWANTWLGHRTSAAVKSQLRMDIATARLARPIDTKGSTGGLITLVTQGLDALDGYYAKYLPQVLLAGIVPVVIGVAVLTADLTSAIILAITIPLIPVFMMLVGWTTQARTARRWAIQTRLAHHFADLVLGLPTLQVFGRAKAQAKGLLITETAHRKETLGTLRISFMSALVLELLSTLSVALVAVIVGFRVVAGDLDLQTALFVLILAPEAYLPVRQVGTHYHDSADGVAAAKAAFALIGDEDTATRPARERSATGVLSVSGLTHTYADADGPAVADFNLSISEGELVVLVGPSGAGKTTILNAIMGFIAPSQGTVLGPKPERTAFVGQNPGMVAGTVADNVRMGFPKATDTAVRAALDEAGAAEIPLDQQVGMDGEGVSAGERRRIATARALLRVTLGRAQLMILDEPTAGLDADSEATLLATLRRLGVAALVITHRPAVMELADRVVRLGPEPAAPAPEPPAANDHAGATSAAQGAPQPAAAPDEAAPPEADSDAPLMRRLFAQVPDSKRRLALALLLSFCATFAAVVLMGSSSWLLAFAATLPPIMFMNAPAVIVRASAIFRGIFRYSERLASHSVALRMQSALRMETYTSLAKTTLLGSRRGDLLTRVIADVTAVQDLIVRVWIPFSASSLVILASSAVVALISPGSALILLVSAILAGVVVPVLARKASEAADAAALPLRGKLADQVHELARTATDLVAYQADTAFLGEFASTDLELRRIEARATWVRGVAEGFQMLAAGAAVIGAILVGATQIPQLPGKFWTAVPLEFQSIFADPGVTHDWIHMDDVGYAYLALLALVPLALHESLNNLAHSAQTVTRARAALQRVEAVLDAPAVGSGDIPAALEESAAPRLRIVNLTAGWPGSEPVVAGLDMEIRAGERVALAGPSGVGKTTVAATVLGLIEPAAGEVELTGRPGYLAQDAHIFNTTVAENVRIGNRDASDADIAEALRRAGLGYLELDRMVGEAASALSGGEARRLALARLLVGQYQVLILDEPTEHLDVPTAAKLLDDIWATAADLPLLVITHDPEVVARCDRVVELDRRPVK
jgi:ATP-binding cassette subfamily C protein CydCD